MVIGNWRLGIVTGLMLVLSTGAGAIAAEQTPQAAAHAALVQRGEHLARLGDCMGCHTRESDKPYAGNLAMESPFGTFYTSNITQDKDTGIGTWTYADFKKALHEGIAKDGAYIYPAMPFTSYTKLVDTDVEALWAYFQTVEPIRNKVRDADLAVIGNTGDPRAALLAWRIPFFEAGRFESDPDRSDIYNEGAYYVQALGHCSACHTPRNIAFAQKKDEFLNGFTLNGWYAPRINTGAGSAVRDWSVDELTTYLKDGELGKQSIAVGPMHEVWRDSLRHLPRSDLHAIAVYLKNLPVDASESMPERIEISSQQASQGKAIYEDNCQSCHGDNGEGEYGVAPALHGNSLVTAAKANSVVMSVLAGFDPKNVWGAMPSYATTLTDEEIAAVSNHVRTAWGNRGSADADTDMVASSRKAGAADIPPDGKRAAAICKNLPAQVIRAALEPGDRRMLQADDDDAALKSIISAYQTARPGAPDEDTVNALSAAYCRAIVKQPDISEETQKAHIAEFSQKIADTIESGAS